MTGIDNGTDTQIDVMFCDCDNKCCDGMFLMNKEIWQIAAKGDLNSKNIRHECIFYKRIRC